MLHKNTTLERVQGRGKKHYISTKTWTERYMTQNKTGRFATLGILNRTFVNSFTLRNPLSHIPVNWQRNSLAYIRHDPNKHNSPREVQLNKREPDLWFATQCSWAINRTILSSISGARWMWPICSSISFLWSSQHWGVPSRNGVLLGVRSPNRIPRVDISQLQKHQKMVNWS